jgi:hypothetical protein
MPDFRLTIDGTDRRSVIEADSLAVRERDGIASIEFDILDKARAIDVPDHAELIAFDWPERIFGGYVADATPTFLGPTRRWRVKGQDYNALLDEDVIPAPAYRSAHETAGERVIWLFATHGTKGLTAGTYVQDIGLMPGGTDDEPEQDFGGKTFREALDYICRLIKGAYHVDFQREVHFYPADVGESLTAPFAISDVPNYSTSFPHVGMTRTRQTSDSRNAVYIRGKGIEGWFPDPPPAAAIRRAGVIRDEAIESAEQLASAGAAFLAKHQTFEQVTATIVRPGLHTGMAIQVSHAGYGMAAEPLMVREVLTKLHTNHWPVYDLTLGSRDETVGNYLGGVAGTADRALEEAQNAATASGEPVADLSIGGANLLANSDFENEAAPGWTVGAWWVFGLIEENGDTVSGTKVARLEEVGYAGTDDALITPPVKVDADDDYWVSAWVNVRSISAGTFRVLARMLDSGGASLGDVVLGEWDAPTGEWVRVSVRLGPNNAYDRTPFLDGTVAVDIYADADGTATLSADVDAMQVERSSLLTAYAPAPYELTDSSIYGWHIAPGAVGSTQIDDDSISTAHLQSGAVEADKVAALAIVAGKIAAGAVSAAEIAASGILADQIKAGTLTLGSLDGFPDVLIVKDAEGDEIGRWGSDGLLIVDPHDELLAMRLKNGVLEFTEDFNALDPDASTWTTAMSGQGISADAIRLGTAPGGHNRVPNSGFELAAFQTPLVTIWPTNRSFATTIGTDVNVAKTATTLAMSAAALAY